MSSFQWTTQDYVYVTAECLIGVLTVMGNSLVLLAITRTRSLRTITNCFIGSLAAADLLVGTILPPTVILPYLGLPRNFHGCVLMNTVVVLITNISILSLLGVALERYLAISNPFRYHRVMSVKRALEGVAVIWIVAILIGLVPTMGWNLGDEGFESCSFTKVIDLKYMVYLIFFGVTLPLLIVMLVIYLYIFHIVRKKQREVAHLTVLSRDQVRNARKQKREVRGAKGLAYVIVLFAVCWLPLHVMNSITVFAPDSSASLQWMLVAIVLSHANSFVNPFLYAFSNSRFKQAMLKILFCGRCKLCYTTQMDDIDTDFGLDKSRGTRLATARPAREESSDCASTLPQPSEDLGREVSGRKTFFTSDRGVVNRAFLADERTPKDNQQVVASPRHSTGKLSRQTETVTSKVTAANGQAIRNCERSQDHRNDQSTANRPILEVRPGDCTSPLSLLDGSSCQLWVTQSSLSRPTGKDDLPVSLSEPQSSVGQQPSTTAPQLASYNEDVMNAHKSGGVNVDRQHCNSVSTKSHFDRQDSSLVSTQPNCATLERQDSKLVSKNPDGTIVSRQNTNGVSKNSHCANVERQGDRSVDSEFLSIHL